MMQLPGEENVVLKCKKEPVVTFFTDKKSASNKSVKDILKSHFTLLDKLVSKLKGSNKTSPVQKHVFSEPGTHFV